MTALRVGCDPLPRVLTPAGSDPSEQWVVDHLGPDVLVRGGGVTGRPGNGARR